MTTPARRARAAGAALIMTLFSIAALAMAVATALCIGSADVLATRNYAGAAAVYLVAESAIAEALQTVNGAGVTDIRTGVIRRWRVLWGGRPRSFAPLDGFAYDVTAQAAPGDAAETGQLVATATGPEGARNVVVANVARVAVPHASPGALYLTPDAPVYAVFGRDTLVIDGRDHDISGGLGSAAPVPGIATRNDPNAIEVVDALTTGQRGDVRGVGFFAGPPAIPAVTASLAAPSAAQLARILTVLLSRPDVVTDAANEVPRRATFGTHGAPEITHLTAAGGVTVPRGARVTGAGILIVDHALTIAGGFRFDGLVVVRERTTVAGSGSGAAAATTVYGALWTAGFEHRSGRLTIRYSAEGLGHAGAVAGPPLPVPVVVTSVVDCSLAPRRTSGCP